MKPLLKLDISEKRNDIKKGCLMYYLKPLNFKWKSFIDKIQKEDIYTVNGNFGLEEVPHVTLLYGILDDDLSKYGGEKHLGDFCLNLPKEVIISSNRLSAFENEEFDVLKFDVNLKDYLNQDNQKLGFINKKIENSFPFKNSYAEYIPHITVGYLKKGTAKKYLANLTNKHIFTTIYLKYNSPNYSFIVKENSIINEI